MNDLSEVQLEEDGRDWPLTTICVHASIAIGQTGCAKASAATKISLEPFTNVPTRAFVRVDAGGGAVWFGQPLLFAKVTTVGGVQHEIAYCKWLDYKLTGIERLKMPLPTTFPLHQWEKTFMGLPPLGGHEHQESESYGVVDASKVLNWEPIVSIGLRTWRPTSEYLIQARARKRSSPQEQAPRGVGEPLFANNVHVWSF